MTTVKSQYTQANPKPNTIKPIVQGIEQLQRLRIATGNRIAAINRLRNQGVEDHIGTQTPADQEKLEKEYAVALDAVKSEYKRITDEVIENNYKKGKAGNLPTPKKFQPSNLINSYSELLLVDQYLRLVDNEEINIGQLEYALDEYPIYTYYLQKIAGVGPKIAGVIISEIDIYQTKYVRNLWAYAGLDTVIYGEYTDNKGVVNTVTMSEINAYYRDRDGSLPMEVNGYPVEFKTKGRDRSRVSQVVRHYVNASGEDAVRNSITFNPYLKTKLIGVLGGSFLKQTATYVDGEKMSTAAREGIAKTLGWTATPSASAAVKKAQVIAFLRANGYSVETKIGPFAKIYYDYRARIESSTKPSHQGLTAAHVHNMAVRYMVKAFLRELYVVWRHIEDLPIYKDYASAKLGYTHDANLEIYKGWGVDVTKFIDPEDAWAVESYPTALQDYVKERDVQVGIVQNEAIAV